MLLPIYLCSLISSFRNWAWAIEQLQIEAINFLQRRPSDSLKVTVHADRRLDNAPDLHFALRPQTRHGFPLPFKVRLHVGEFLDDGLDAVMEARPREVLVD